MFFIHIILSAAFGIVLGNVYDSYGIDASEILTQWEFYVLCLLPQLIYFNAHYMARKES